MNVGQSFYNGLFATGFVVLCLSIGCKIVVNKCKSSSTSRTKQISVDNEHQDVLRENSINSETAPEENEYIFSHYERINENEMIEMSPPTTSELCFDSASNINHSLQLDNTYLTVIEDTNNQTFDSRNKIKGPEPHKSMIRCSPREERNISTSICLTKNTEGDKSNTINTECTVKIVRNNFKNCKASNNSISVSSSSSEQSFSESIHEKDRKACEQPNQYMSLNANDMEYLNSYSTPITENKLRKSEFYISNTSDDKNEQNEQEI